VLLTLPELGRQERAAARLAGRGCSFGVANAGGGRARDDFWMMSVCSSGKSGSRHVAAELKEPWCIHLVHPSSARATWSFLADLRKRCLPSCTQHAARRLWKAGSLQAACSRVHDPPAEGADLCNATGTSSATSGPWRLSPSSGRQAAALHACSCAWDAPHSRPGSPAALAPTWPQPLLRPGAAAPPPPPRAHAACLACCAAHPGSEPVPQPAACTSRAVSPEITEGGPAAASCSLTSDDA
jgi:hypothetical protein